MTTEVIEIESPIQVLERESRRNSTEQLLPTIPDIFTRSQQSKKAIWFGRVGMLMGALASVEYFMLGIEFAARISSSTAAMAAFGLGSLITNSSMNVLVNQEEFEQIASLPLGSSETWSDRRRVSAVIAMLMHAGISAFTITGMLIRSLKDTHILLRIGLSIPSFISNLAIFYYTDDELLGKSYYHIRNYFLDPKEMATFRSQYIETLDNLENHVAAISIEEWPRFLHELNLRLENPESFYRANNTFISNYFKTITIKRGHSLAADYVVIFAGLLVGILSVSAYYNVGVEGAAIFCPREDSCSSDLQRFLEVLLGANTFSSYLILSDLNMDAFYYFFRKVNAAMKNFLFANCSFSTKLLVFILIGVACVFSTIPNVAITMDYLNKWNLVFLLYGTLVASAFSGSFSTNTKWFLTLLNDFYIFILSSGFIERFKNYCREPEFQPVEAEESYKRVLFEKKVLLDVITRSKQKLLAIPVAELQELQWPNDPEDTVSETPTP